METEILNLICDELIDAEQSMLSASSPEYRAQYQAKYNAIKSLIMKINQNENLKPLMLHALDYFKDKFAELKAKELGVS